MKREYKKMLSYSSFYIFLSVCIILVLGLTMYYNNHSTGFSNGEIPRYKHYDEIPDLILEKKALIENTTDAEVKAIYEYQIRVYEYLLENKLDYNQVTSSSSEFLSNSTYAYYDTMKLVIHILVILSCIYFCRTIFARDFDTGLAVMLYTKGDKMKLLMKKISSIFVATFSMYLFIAFIIFLMGFLFYNTHYIILVGTSIFKFNYFTYFIVSLLDDFIPLFILAMLITSIFLLTKESNYSSVASLVICLLLVLVPVFVPNIAINSINCSFLVAGKHGCDVTFYNYLNATVIKYIIGIGIFTCSTYLFKRRNI